MKRWLRPVSPLAGSSARIERFRGRNRVGEQISGNFLGWENPGLGWVDFQGTVLLASMASQPEIGARLHFLIKQLTPDIILQELQSHNLPGISLLLQRFWTAQTRLETSLASLWPPAKIGSTQLGERLKTFQNLSIQHPELRADYSRQQSALKQINAELATRKLGRFLTLPWLADRVQGASLLLSAGPEPTARVAAKGPLGSNPPVAPTQALFACTHPALGPMEITFTLSGPQPGWLLQLEQEVVQSASMAFLSDWLHQAFPQTRTRTFPFLGIKALPIGAHAGILPRLLFTPEPGRFRLNLKV